MAEIQFTGNVGADAEVRFTRSGSPVLNARVCDSKSRKLENGEWETVAETWYNVSLFGPEAEALAPTVRKGSRVRVAGEYYARPFEGRNGPGISHDVTAIGVKVLPSRNQGQPQGGGGQQGGAQQGGGFGGPAGGDAWGGQPAAGGGWDNTPAASEPPF